jgi:hypothetical protein
MRTKPASRFDPYKEDEVSTVQPQASRVGRKWMRWIKSRNVLLASPGNLEAIRVLKREGGIGSLEAY